MTDFSIEKAATFSIVLHIVMFVLVIAAQRASMKTPEMVYTIDLVTQNEVREQKEEPPAPAKAEVMEKSTPSAKKTSEPSTTVAAVTVDKSAIKHKEDAIRALKQKQEQREAETHLKDRLKELELTSKLSSIREAAERKGTAAKEALSREAAGPQAEAILKRYMQGIEAAIKKNWVFQDPGQNTLRTDVLIGISADGGVEVKKISKPSGNRTFDQSTLKAIAKTPAVDPPPFGEPIEILISFWPEK